MKGIFKSKARKAFLTSAICLALSSTVFAMPVLDKNQTESTVKISGLDTKTGTVDVSGLGLVDWKSFGLANDETLKFVFAKVDGSSNIINRVTGTDMSTIAGHMISQGEGGVYLINPNGIVISGTARLDVGSLMLSTISFTENDPQKLLAAVGNNTFNMQDTKNGVLKIEDGAKINFYDFLALLGGKVQIADNVTISDGLERLGTDGNKIVGDGSKDENAFIVAGNQMSMSYEKDPVWSVTTQTGNDVTIGKSSVKADALEIIGNTATLNGTTITSANEGKEGYVDIFAGNTVGFDDDKDEYQLSATSANTINAKGLTMTATDPMLFGGKVDIADSNITATDGEIGINALNTYGEVSGGKDTWAATKDNTLTISNTTLTDSTEQTSEDLAKHGDKNFIDLQGGNVKLTSVTTSSHGIEIAAKSGYTEEGEETETTGTTTHNLASSGMDVSLTGGSITTTDDIGVTGKTVTTNGTELKAGGNLILAAGSDAALKEAKTETGNSALSVKAGANDAVSVTGGSLSADKNMGLYGGSVKLDNVKTAKATGYIDLIAGNASNYERVYNETSKQHDDGHDLTASSANAITVKDSTLTSGDGIAAFGGKISVSGSTLTNTGKVGEIDVNAVSEYGTVHGDDDTWTATKDNTLTVSKSTLTNSSTADDDKAIELQGGKVTIMDGTSVTSANVYVASKSGYREDEDGTNHQFATAGMDTHVQNSTLKATGGSVDVTGMTVTVDGKSDLSASHGMILATGSDVAVKDAPGGNGDPTITLAKDATNVKVGKRVTFGEGTWKSLQPGQETVEDTPIPVEPTTPTEPSEPVTPTPAEQKTVDENVAQGKTDMETTLADNAENRAAAVAQVAQKLSDEPMAEASKGAQVSGYLQAIQESEDLSSTEKAELQRTVIRNVEATAVADDHAKDKQTEAAGSSQEAIADTTAAAADVPAAADSSAEAATVTVDGEEQE